MSEKLSALIPCPFCGGEPELITRGNAFTKKRSSEIRCTKCNCLLVVGAVHQSLEWTAEIVSKKWNQRAASSALLGDAATRDIAAREFAKSLYADLEHMRDGHDMAEEETGGDFGDEYKEKLRHAAEEWIATEFKRAAYK